MAKIIRITDTNGNSVEFEDEVKASGGMKDAYFSPKRDYVVLFFRDKPKPGQRDRLEKITDQYRRSIFEQEGGDYLKKLYCWPYAVVEHEGRLGVVAPFYDSAFFFKHGSVNNDSLGIKGKDKEGKWFTSARLRKRSVDPRELGDYSTHIKLCLQLARSVHRMHAAGLAHSDLSYKNVLVDPSSGRACMIDIDGLVVPGKFPPEVIGTPDFIAPEVIKTQHLPHQDPNRKLPSRQTDLHALAVLVYMYLLYRHPLKGSKFHHEDTQTDLILSMGEKALFIEHPGDPSNRVKTADLDEKEMPWADTTKIPYSVTGPYLSELFL
ncbi:MAG TPA: lipopolysaccharide kinase InaA family protein, partial [Fibrobacteria bacterium]|nr:lipopolysaccharide kinase InaA family protein [Fibrobacteria bacterium]